MQVTETQNEGLKRGYKITVSAAELESKVNEKLTEARPEVELKGFRKGRVPMALLKKRLGARVMGDAMQEAIDGAMAKHFEETGDRPAMQPQVTMTNEAWKEGDDVEVSMTYETLPDVPEVEFGTIALERLVVKADDAAIDEALASLAKSVPSFAGDDSGEPAKDGDQVVIDFVGRIGDEAFEGGSGEDQPLVLGSNTFIPGFEAQLVGAKTGDEVKVTVTFPENYTAKKLAGKEAVFDCTVKAVKARQETPIDDALAKKFGADDLAALRTQITERLENEYRGAARSVLKRRLLDALDEKVGFELPPSLVEAEANQIAHQLWHEEHDHPDAPGSAEHDDEHEHGEHEGHDHGEHDHEGHDHEGHDHDAHAHGHIEPTDEHRKLAERRVRLGLLLAEVGRKQEIKVTDQEMTQAVLEQARQYPGQERQFFEFVQQNAGVRQQIQAPIFEDKVVDFIFELAQITDRDVDRDALKAAVEALDD